MVDRLDSSLLQPRPSRPRIARLGPWLWLLATTVGCATHESADTFESTDFESSDTGSLTTLTTDDFDGSTSADGTSDTGDHHDEALQVRLPGGSDDPEVYGPEPYPGGRTHSPITPFVADRIRQIAQWAPDNADNVFMKTGASSTVSHRTLHCFVEDPIDLGSHEHLRPTLDYFLGGDAAGTTPFDRETEAARIGHHAGWAISGNPSPIQTELEILWPRFALVHFGTNDMGWGDTYGDALVYFHSNMTTMLEELIDQGVVPIIFGITRRGDYASAQRWVNTFNATLRGLAQSYQIPFIDMFHAIDPLDGHGLASDGLHLEAYADGACILDESGLQHGYNIRNLIALEALDRVAAVMVDQHPGIDDPAPPMAGQGTPDSPWMIEALPFTDTRNTEQDGESFVDIYSGCNDTDESGPELWYRFEVEQTTRIRAAVLDAEGVDIDVHLVDEQATGEGCIARGHQFIQTTVEPGTYHFALDTWVDDGVPQSGEYLFVVLECDANDASCNP